MSTPPVYADRRRSLLLSDTTQPLALLRRRLQRKTGRSQRAYTVAIYLDITRARATDAAPKTETVTAMEIARRSGLHISAVSRILRGERAGTVESILTLGRALQISTKSLLPFLEQIRAEYLRTPRGARTARTPRPRRRRQAA